MTKTFEKRNETKVKDKIRDILFYKCSIKSSKMGELLEVFNGSKTLHNISISHNVTKIKSHVALALGELIRSIKVIKPAVAVV